MRILILNWKDHHHPLAGGAEDYTFNIMKRLANRGHEITWFTSMYEGALTESREEGITFIRRGTYRTVHGKSKRYVQGFENGDKPDVIIDEVNTRPFNPSRWLRVKVPVVNLIHQLAREVWFQEVPLPLALVGRYILEDSWLKAIRTHMTVTVSRSTELDLKQLGFERVNIVYNALPDGINWKVGPKEDPPLLVYLGRLTKGKRPSDCLEAFREIRSRLTCSMIVLGSGPLLERLRRKYPEVRFLGHVSESVKHDILSRATLLLASGTREGWNRGVLEAQAHEVVPVVQDIPGLRDSVPNAKTGAAVPAHTPKALADKGMIFLQSPDYLKSVSTSCRQWAAAFTYSKSTNEFESLLLREVGQMISPKPLATTIY